MIFPLIGPSDDDDDDDDDVDYDNEVMMTVFKTNSCPLAKKSDPKRRSNSPITKTDGLRHNMTFCQNVT